MNKREFLIQFSNQTDKRVNESVNCQLACTLPDERFMPKQTFQAAKVLRFMVSDGEEEEFR